MPKHIDEAMMRHMQLLPATSLCVTLFCWVPVIWGCSPSRTAARPDSSSRTDEPGTSGDEERSGATSAALHAEVNRGPNPLLDDREPQPDAALPRLTYKHLGMHIGGESNSAESKRPWLEDIERNEDAFLSCFRFVSDPPKSGSYGVDLFVGKSGGAPEVRGSRQKLGGEEFDQCMRRAFSTVEFHVPERPTVFSYSIFFELEGQSSD